MLDLARALRAALAAGQLLVFARSLLLLEIVNVPGRRWGWKETALGDLGGALDVLGFELVEPDVSRVANWTARGLTAYAAACVAAAEAATIDLVTDDELISPSRPGSPKPSPAKTAARNSLAGRHVFASMSWTRRRFF